MKKRINKTRVKHTIFIIIIVWMIMNVFLSIKVSMYVQSAYDNYGINNPYDMKDEYFARLTERQEDEEVRKEKNIFIPITLWYGTRAKTWCYLYYKSYDESGNVCFDSDGIIRVDLRLKNGKWKVDYVMSTQEFYCHIIGKSF